MKTKISKWGNCLALRIPKSVATEAQMSEGTPVDLILQDGRIVIKPVRTKQLKLHSLLEKVSPENLHEEISTGAPRGREAW